MDLLCAPLSEPDLLVAPVGRLQSRLSGRFSRKYSNLVALVVPQGEISFLLLGYYDSSLFFDTLRCSNDLYCFWRIIICRDIERWGCERASVAVYDGAKETAGNKIFVEENGLSSLSWIRSLARKLFKVFWVRPNILITINNYRKFFIIICSNR